MPPNESNRDDERPDSAFREWTEGEVAALWTDSKSMKDEIKAMHDENERLKELIKTNSSPTNNKKKTKKRKRGSKLGPASWLDGNWSKIAAVLVSIALLITVSLSQNVGEGGIFGVKTSFLRTRRVSDAVQAIKSSVVSFHHTPEENDVQIGGDRQVKELDQAHRTVWKVSEASKSSAKKLNIPVGSFQHAPPENNVEVGGDRQVKVKGLDQAQRTVRKASESSKASAKKENDLPDDSSLHVPLRPWESSKKPQERSKWSNEPRQVRGLKESISQKGTEASTIDEIASSEDSYFHVPEETDENNEVAKSDSQLARAKQRIAEGDTMHLVTSHSNFLNLYYLDGNGFCKNDPAQRPSYYNQLGITLFETLEDCCSFWRSEESDDCMEKSLSLHSTSNTPSPSNLLSGSEAGVDVPEIGVSTPPSTIEQNPSEAIIEEEDAEPLCDADPTNCGCPHQNQTDYRGIVNKTRSGVQCERWDAEWMKDVLEEYLTGTEAYNMFGGNMTQVYAELGLEGSYCRNPFPELFEGAWCMKAGGSDPESDWDYCNVRTCNKYTKPDKQTCGCDVVKQSDYRGTMNRTRNGAECANWDSNVTKLWAIEVGFNWALKNFSDALPDAGLKDNNYCRNPMPEAVDHAWCVTTDGDYGECNVTMCDPDLCMPPCGNPNQSKSGYPSFLQAEECCDDGDSSCKCTLLKDACRISLENNGTDFCDDALSVCYEDIYDDNLVCSMYEQICSSFPGELTCEAAAEKCCSFERIYWAESRCRCDFYTYTAVNLDVEIQFKADACKEASKGRVYSSRFEPDELGHFYRDTSGDYWINNTGWLSETHHCEWFGLKCNENGDLIEMNLRNNNLTGFDAFFRLEHTDLKKLDLSGNRLYGEVYSGAALFLRKLEYIDISNNEFGGHADMRFPPDTFYADFSNNSFTTVTFKRHNAAYENLQVVDLSNNQIDQDASEVFLNIPPNLEKLILSGNKIRGEFPDPFPSLGNIRRLEIANNNIKGPLPDFSRATPRIKELDLSNQRQTQDGGLAGTISPDFSRLDDLSSLNLAFNNLTRIPSDLGNLQKLKLLDISSNFLNQEIPSELGKLSEALEILDLSNNELKGKIPSSLAEFADKNYSSIYLSGNTELLDPAPLMLCFLSNFDFANDPRMCPSERSALKHFYESSKGGEWTNDTFWLDPYESYCLWQGVECKSGNITGLDLRNNGLSGTISNEAIAGLTMIEVLDLSDNDIKGTVPSEIGRLSELVSLRLSYNEITGEMPVEFGSLENLELVQLHSNRIKGTIPTIAWTREDPWSFIADCGNPSDFDKSLNCTNCTMCCNAQEDCYPQGLTDIQEAKFKNYYQFSFIFLACFFGACLVAALLLFCYDKYKNRNLPRGSTRRLIEKSNQGALDALGDDSVYSFFLGKSWVGWIVALGTIVVQLFMLFIFVEGAEFDLADDNTDLVYTWKCPRDQIECDNKADLTGTGWMVFGFLMATHLLKDIINGCKMIALASKERQTLNNRIRFFCGGLLLSFVALFTLYVSAIYNKAIATSNTEIIINSVAILFITDADEQLYDIFMVTSVRWVAGISKNRVEELMKHNSALQDEVNDLKAEVSDLKSGAEYLRQEIKGMKEMMNSKGFNFGPQEITRTLPISSASIEGEGLSFQARGNTAITLYDANDPSASEEKEELSEYHEKHAYSDRPRAKDRE